MGRKATRNYCIIIIQSILIIHRFRICKLACLLKFICSPYINNPSTLHSFTDTWRGNAPPLPDVQHGHLLPFCFSSQVLKKIPSTDCLVPCYHFFFFFLILAISPFKMDPKCVEALFGFLLTRRLAMCIRTRKSSSISFIPARFIVLWATGSMLMNHR